MPTYDYRCAACGHELETFQSINEPALRKCPKCGKSKLERQIGAGAGVLFRGGGFYQTDYRSDSYKKGEGAEKAASTPSSSTPDAKSPGESKSSASTPSDGKAGADKVSAKSDNPSAKSDKPKKKPDARG